MCFCTNVFFFAFCRPYLAFFSFHCPWTGTSISDSGNDAQEKPALSDWMKQYLVAEIPPYRQPRQSTDVRDVDRETGGSRDGAFEDGCLPANPSGERESAQVTDWCSSPGGKMRGAGEGRRWRWWRRNLLFFLWWMYPMRMSTVRPACTVVFRDNFRKI